MTAVLCRGECALLTCQRIRKKDAVQRENEKRQIALMPARLLAALLSPRRYQYPKKYVELMWNLLLPWVLYYVTEPYSRLVLPYPI